MIHIEFRCGWGPNSGYTSIIYQEDNIVPNVKIIDSEMNIDLYHVILETLGAQEMGTRNTLYFLSEDGVERTASFILSKYYSTMIEFLQHQSNLNTPNAYETIGTGQKLMNVYEYFKNVEGSASSRFSEHLLGLRTKFKNKSNIKTLNKLWESIMNGFNHSIIYTRKDISKALEHIKTIFAGKHNPLIRKIVNGMLPFVDQTTFDGNIKILIDRYYDVLILKNLLIETDNTNKGYELLGKRIYLVMKVDHDELTEHQNRIIESIKKEIPEIEETNDLVSYAYNLVIVRNLKSVSNFVKVAGGQPLHDQIYTIENCKQDYLAENFDDLNIAEIKEAYDKWNFRNKNSYSSVTKKRQILMTCDVDNEIETNMIKYVTVLKNENKDTLIGISNNIDSWAERDNICATLANDKIIGEGVFGKVYSVMVNGIECAVKTGEIEAYELRQMLEVSNLVQNGTCIFFPLVVTSGICSKCIDKKAINSCQSKLDQKLVNYDHYDNEAKHFAVMEKGEITLMNYITSVAYDADIYSRLLCQLFYAMFCMRKYTGFVHEDLHLQNIMVDNSQNIMIIDFGRCARSYAISTDCFSFLFGLMESVQHALTPEIYTLLSLLTRRVIKAYRTSNFPDDLEYELVLISLGRNKYKEQ